ncbi:14611_t:CDS:2 [Funneliformis mosseae]|uniref:14611_t:CDS:1 n=1 Tax=Funneliformis mosseae TaxID=27381 RepID=A0A9N8ZJK8_FUNMO|nr:14611_t:CDS:2 [Funneliformis mosseae]
MWTFPSCMCSQVFYNNLVSCGNACNIPVDEPAKYESDSEIGNHPEFKFKLTTNVGTMYIEQNPDSPDADSKQSVSLGLKIGIPIGIAFILTLISVIGKKKCGGSNKN